MRSKINGIRDFGVLEQNHGARTMPIMPRRMSCLMSSHMLMLLMTSSYIWLLNSFFKMNTWSLNLRVCKFFIRNLTDCHSSDPRSPSPGKILERQQWHVLLGITYTLIKLSLAIMRTKERKIVFSKLLSWHKEVIQGFQGPQNIRMAETSLGFTNTSLSPRPTCAWPCMATLVCNILKRTWLKIDFLNSTFNKL